VSSIFYFLFDCHRCKLIALILHQFLITVLIIFSVESMAWITAWVQGLMAPSLAYFSPLKLTCPLHLISSP
jgi:hypothetical protein